MLGIGREVVIFLCATLSGIVILSSYEILRLLRRLIVHNMLVINLQDLFFWLGTSAYLFRQMYLMTYGSIRWFFIVGVICGCLLAAFVVSTIKKILKKKESS